MPQTRYVGSTKIHNDHSYVGGEVPAIQKMMGNSRIVLSEGQPQKPEILVCTCGAKPTFFYADGSAVNRLPDVEHLPERARWKGKLVNPKALAQAYVEQQDPPTEEVVDTLEPGPRGGALVGKATGKKGKAASAAAKKVVEISGGVVLGTKDRPAVATGRD